ncbi:MAG: radical SAM protein [Proteobacteria bacterium]|nr:radical SAM protein [Pseudomonadota bacterium]
MKILFLQLPHPANPGRNLPLASAILKASISSLNFIDARDVIILNNRQFDKQGCHAMIQQVKAEQPDMICISLYLWNVDRSLNLIKEIKACLPQTIIVAGGPEVTPESPIFLNNIDIDYAITGEGEQPLKLLLHHFNRPSYAVDNILGVGLRVNGKWKFNPVSVHYCAINDTPSPLLLDYLNVEDYQEIMLFTMRGCFQGCSYCSWSATGRLRAYNIERLKDELAYLYLKAKSSGQKKTVFIGDSAFNTSPVFREICEAIYEINTEDFLDFHCFIQADLINEYSAKLLKLADFKLVEIDLPSIHPDVLKNVNRPDRLDDFTNGIKTLKNYDIPLAVATILGLPGDSLDTFHQNMDFITTNTLRPIVHNLALTHGALLKRKKDLFGLVSQSSPPFYIEESHTFPQKDILKAMNEYQAYSADLNLIRNLGLPLMTNTSCNSDTGTYISATVPSLRQNGPVTSVVLTLPDACSSIENSDIISVLSHTMSANPKILIRLLNQDTASNDIKIVHAMLNEIALHNKHMAWDLFIQDGFPTLATHYLKTKLYNDIQTYSCPFLMSLDYFHQGNENAIRRKSANLFHIVDADQFEKPVSRLGEQNIFLMRFNLELPYEEKLNRLADMTYTSILVEIEASRTLEQLEAFMHLLSRISETGKQIFFNDWVLQRWWEQDILRIKPVKQDRCEVSIGAHGISARLFTEKDLYWDSLSRWKLFNAQTEIGDLKKMLIEKAILRLSTVRYH